DNNNPNVPGNANGSLAGGGPVGTGVILAGTTYITLYHNTITNNGAWGELIVDLPDPESGPAMCQGGTDIPAGSQTPEVCYYQAFGNLSRDNSFYAPNAGCPSTPTATGCNGGFGNPTNGDIGLAAITHDPGNCFSGDTDASATAGPSTDPAGIETNPAYAPSSNHGNRPTPNPTGATVNGLYGVACPSPTQCTAVGSYKNSANMTVTTAQQWNGSSWAIQSTPNPAGALGSALLRVACTSASACTAVGYDN